MQTFPFKIHLSMQTDQLLQTVLAALDDGKGRDVKVMDVKDKTSITDFMVIASGTSERHVNSLADRVIEKANESHVKPLGIEGQPAGEWVLVDLGDVIVHVMKPPVREFYQLEKLWDGSYSEKRPASAKSLSASA
jgi:ribosome-associated protein